MKVPNWVLEKMVPPYQRRPGKWMEGVMQVHLTRACDLACSNCTQGSQFGGKATFMSLGNFDKACQSVKEYFGLIGIFGGNPALHPQFAEICEILRSHFPKVKCGIWCNHPKGKGKIMHQTFNPRMSNLNVHLNSEAYWEFKRDWPDSMPFGADKDSRHSPVHGNPVYFEPDEEKRWELISNCDINQHWSPMICEFRGELRGFFCEVAGGQAMLNQHNPDYPDTGIPFCEVCNGSGLMKAYRGEPSQGTELVRCDNCFGYAWWQNGMFNNEFTNQVAHHCTNCLVPLRGHGALAQHEQVTTVTPGWEHLKPKGQHLLQVLDNGTLSPETSRRVIDYLGR